MIFNFFKNKKRKQDDDVNYLKMKVKRMSFEMALCNKKIKVNADTQHHTVIHSLQAFLNKLQFIQEVNIIEDEVHNYLKSIDDVVDKIGLTYVNLELDKVESTFSDYSNSIISENVAFDNRLEDHVSSLEKLLIMYKYLHMVTELRPKFIKESIDKESNSRQIIFEIINEMKDYLLETMNKLEEDYHIQFDKELTEGEIELKELITTKTKMVDEFILTCYFDNSFLNHLCDDPKNISYENLAFSAYDVVFRYKGKDGNLYRQEYDYPRKEKETDIDHTVSNLSAILILSKYVEII